MAEVLSNKKCIIWHGPVSYTHLDVYKRQVPRDRQSTFEPQIIKKHQRDVSSIEGKVLAVSYTHLMEINTKK